MKIIILSNGPGLKEVVTLYGHSSEWIPNSITDKNISFEVIKTYETSSFNIDNADGFIITGSKFSVYDNENWIKALKNKVDVILNLDKPVLGICFGHQLLAECLGGKVEKNLLGWELGSYNISLTRDGLNSKLFKSFNNGDFVYESHQDVVSILPNNAIELAFSNKGNQSFSYGDKIFGVQFHPEFSYEVTRKLMDLRKDRGIVIDNDQLYESVNSKKILDNFIEIVKENK
ncbi:MAG: hypothetical protein CMG61_01005 [Candidatus Marinimicrobia bacterium]|nr:hypothetical protein [Candidatus Neomarinimicrobiota bacterium]|tara:strand:- start:14899 stop:15591 length:693 start_codon:yes stop_codon:yes gene_type:complete